VWGTFHWVNKLITAILFADVNPTAWWQQHFFVAVYKSAVGILTAEGGPTCWDVIPKTLKLISLSSVFLWFFTSAISSCSHFLQEAVTRQQLVWCKFSFCVSASRSLIKNFAFILCTFYRKEKCRLEKVYNFTTMVTVEYSFSFWCLKNHKVSLPNIFFLTFDTRI